MDWAEPHYSRTRIDKAGEFIKKSDSITDEAAFNDAAMVMADWRSAHLYPLSVFGKLLDAVNTETASNGLQSARLKRLLSIAFKLFNSEKPMRLSQMQDIGGCRLVVDSLDLVSVVNEAFQLKASAHELIGIDDYILKPKPSGYRSAHLIYRYRGDNAWNGMQIEVQVRSRLQHAWAAAVETVDKFSSTYGDLKAGYGDSLWLDFFRLMGAAIALKEEREPVPATPVGLELLESIRERAAQLEVIRKLKAWSTAVRIVGSDQVPADAHHFLLKFDLQNSRTIIQAFNKEEVEQANAAYKAAEHHAKELAESSPQILQDVVLVSVDKIAELQEAYPSYFADTDEFIKMVEAAINTQPSPYETDC